MFSFCRSVSSSTSCLYLPLLSIIRPSVRQSVYYCTIVISMLMLCHFSVFLFVHNNYHMHTSGWSIFSVFAFCIFAWDQAGGMHVLLDQQAVVSSSGSLMNNKQSLHQQITSNQLWPACICIESLQIRNCDFLQIYHLARLRLDLFNSKCVQNSPHK